MHGLQSFFKTPGKAQPGKVASQQHTESPNTVLKPRQPSPRFFASATELKSLPDREGQTAGINEAFTASEWLTEEGPRQETPRTGVSHTASTESVAKRPDNMRALFGRAPSSSMPEKGPAAAPSSPNDTALQKTGQKGAMQSPASGQMQPVTVSSTADTCWQTLLRSIAEGNTEVGKLLKDRLSVEALSRAGARSVPSAVVSVLTTLLHTSVSAPLHEQIWSAMRNILLQLQKEGPAQPASPSKVSSKEHSAPVSVTVEELLMSRPLHAAIFRDAAESHLPAAMTALRFLGDLVCVGGSATAANTLTVQSQATIASEAEHQATCLLQIMQEGSHAQATLVCQIWTSLLQSGQAIASSVEHSHVSGAIMDALHTHLQRPCDATKKAMLEECVDALVSLMCHPALIQATTQEGSGTRASVEKLLECQDQHGFGAAAALEVMRMLASTGVEGKTAVQPLQGLIASRELVWRDLQCLEEAAGLIALLRGP